MQTDIYPKENESVEIVANLTVGPSDRLHCDLGQLDELIIKSLGMYPGKAGRYKIEVTKLD